MGPPNNNGWTWVSLQTWPFHHNHLPAVHRTKEIKKREINIKSFIFYGRPMPCGFFLSIFFFSSPNLSGRRLDVYHTSTHGVALVQI